MPTIENTVLSAGGEAKFAAKKYDQSTGEECSGGSGCVSAAECFCKYYQYGQVD